jgi:hypothetical protein
MATENGVIVCQVKTRALSACGFAKCKRAAADRVNMHAISNTVGTLCADVTLAFDPQAKTRARSSARVLVRQPHQRTGWDSNPRYRFRHAGFRDRFLQPLGHLSNTANTLAKPQKLGVLG